jgi:predicted RNase H-like nuclease
MTTLLVGFDSAWTAHNSGGIVAALQLGDGSLIDLGNPRIANFEEAEHTILNWQTEQKPTATIILLDQPTIVSNAAGQRPVENIVGSPVGLRYGGIQPANIAKSSMFGVKAPIWPFLVRFGGPGDPMISMADTKVYETYPVLTMIALDWILPDTRATGRLPKYNPKKKTQTFAYDWQFVCERVSSAFREYGLTQLLIWIDEIGRKPAPRKGDQDCLDACVCLLVAIHMAQGKNCLMIGDLENGYIVVPDSDVLQAEFAEFRARPGKSETAPVRTFQQAPPG